MAISLVISFLLIKAILQMAYYERILANLDIFKKKMWLDVSDRLRLLPIMDPQNEAASYLQNSHDVEVQKYIPGAFVQIKKESIRNL